eukprot:GHRQ01023966.1.p1 GENE.GHRQ01023966.1~~GHRQ01023966.1.p1  ORF type:complete len:130 (-),score=25.16 GHRQ01023966.1:723-1112(-)
MQLLQEVRVPGLPLAAVLNKQRHHMSLKRRALTHYKRRGKAAGVAAAQRTQDPAHALRQWAVVPRRLQRQRGGVQPWGGSLRAQHLRHDNGGSRRAYAVCCSQHNDNTHHIRKVCTAGSLTALDESVVA